MQKHLIFLLISLLTKIFAIGQRYDQRYYRDQYQPKYAISTPLSIDLEYSYIVSQNRQWTQIQLAVEGGKQPYEYLYDQYPQNWRFVNNNIYVPKADMSKNQKFPCRIRILDRNGNQARATVVFSITNLNLKISQILYPYQKIFNDDFFNSNGCKGRPKFIRNQYCQQQMQNYQKQLIPKIPDPVPQKPTVVNTIILLTTNGSLTSNNTINSNDVTNNQIKTLLNNIISTNNTSKNQGNITKNTPNVIIDLASLNKTPTLSSATSSSSNLSTTIQNNQNNGKNVTKIPSLPLNNSEKKYTNNSISSVNQNKNTNSSLQNTNRSDVPNQEVIIQLNQSQPLPSKTEKKLSNQQLKQNNKNSNIFLNVTDTSNSILNKTNKPLSEVAVATPTLKVENSTANLPKASQSSAITPSISISTNVSNNTNLTSKSQIDGGSSQNTTINPIILNPINNSMASNSNNFSNDTNLIQGSSKGNPTLSASQNNINPVLSNTSASATPITVTPTAAAPSIVLATVPQQNPAFFKLLNSSQIQTLIASSDSLGLIKLVDDTYNTANLSCEQKSSYIADFLSRIETGRAMQNFKADQLQSVINLANSALKNLTYQIESISNESKTLVTDTIKQQLKIHLVTLEGLYAQFNGIDTSTAPLEAQIQTLKQDIYIQNAKSDVDRQQLIRQKLAFNDADNVVKIIEAQLNIIYAQRNQTQSNIDKMQSNINDLEVYINSSVDNITIAQQELINLQNTADTQRINSGNLQAVVQNYRTQIARASKKQDYLLPQLMNLQSRLQIQRKKILSDDYQKIKQMVSDLQNNLPSLQKYIDDNYYQCISASNSTSLQNGTSIIYILTVPQFQAYIQKSYQLKPDWDKIPIYSQSVKLNLISILDTMWQSAYGVPYDGPAFANTTQFSFKDDFNCLAPSTLQSGIAIITSISSRFMTAQSLQGNAIKLNLGVCTRMQAAQYIPKIGQNIYWRGNPLSKNQFNVYRASCI